MNFLKSDKTAKDYLENLIIEDSKSSGMTTYNVGHTHRYTVDLSGNGQTDGPTPKQTSKAHTHKINSWKVMSTDGHIHNLIRD